MAVNAATVKGWVNGEFSSVDDTVVDLFIAQASRRIDPSVFGERADDAHLYLSMHMLAVARRNSSDGGAPTMVTAGPLSRQFGQNPNPDDFDSTTYGRMYKSILEEVPRTPVVIC